MMVGWTVAVLGMSALAAPEATVRVVAGELGVGESGVVEVLVVDDGRPLRGTLTRNDGVAVQRVGPGRFRTEVWWKGTPQTWPATITTGGNTLPVDILVDLPPRVSEVQWPDRMVGVAGAKDPVDLVVQWSGQSTVDDLWMAAGAGSISSVRQDAASVVVGLQVPAAPFPRAVPVLAVDLAAPGAPPALGTVILRARTQIPVQTVPGTQVTVQVGGRTLGPVVADDTGAATITAWLRPGDDTARLQLADPAGNVNTSTIRLGGDPRPHLVGLATPGQPGERRPSVVVAATTATGRPWTGRAPTCATPAGTHVAIVPVGPGIWRGPLTHADLELGTLECHLGLDAQAVLRLPRPPPRPAEVVLRVSPPELDARSPDASVRAWVADIHGDRLPVAPPVVTVDHGGLEADSTAPAGVALHRYDGEGAVPHGKDTVHAQWSAPVGGGPVRDLELRWTRTNDRLQVYGRALDNAGHPLPDTALVFALGEGRADGTRGTTGWSEAGFPVAQSPQWLTVRGVQSGRSVGAWVLPRGGGSAPPPSADLSTHTTVRIVTGPVRRVGIQVDPPTLRTLDGQAATIILELLDRDGNPVTDLPVELFASRGSLTPPRVRPDGTIEATFTPDRAGDIGKVEIVARSPEDHFPATATELELVAEDLYRAPGLHIGWLAGGDGVSSPWVSIDGDLPLPVLPERVLLHLSAGFYGLRAEAADPATGQDLSVSADLAPLGVGLVARQPRGHLVTWAGASMLAVPYRVQVAVDATTGVRGLALAPPGAHAYTGAGLRTRNGEIDLSLGYLFIRTDAGDSGWQGSAGGILSTLGYRHSF